MGSIIGLGIYLIFLGVLLILPITRDLDLISTQYLGDVFGTYDQFLEWRDSIYVACQGGASLKNEWVMQFVLIQAAHFPIAPLRGGIFPPMILGALFGSKKPLLILFGIVLLILAILWFILSTSAALFIFCYGD